uniref:Peptide synthetase NRPS6 n=1 Tax=Streptomyces verticillus TaxID=29309 RepID=Q9FB24_9ACTN|nr:peptide synthetase NRPS6 [Streptomyces verticillus]
MTTPRITDLLTELRGRQVTLTADGDRLHCRAPRGALTDELLATIRARRDELLAHLRADRRIPRHDGPAPLSFAQERLWLLHQFHPHDSAYNIPLHIALRGPLNPAALRAALAEVVRRHDVLRTRYAISRGLPRPVVEPAHTPPLPLTDLTGLPAHHRDAELARLAAQEARRPFDLAQGPVLRARLLRTAPEEHRLLLTRHHIASDGWSLDILLRELGTFYRAGRDGTPAGLDALPLRYADFAAYQREQAERPETAERSTRWARHLRGAPATLDVLGPPPAEPSHAPAGTVRTDLPAALVTGLRQLGGRARTTLFPLLLSAFGLALAGPPGPYDVMVGIPVAGRPRTELEPLIGCFATIAPMRLTSDGTEPLTRLAARAQQHVQDALDGPDVPFERLVHALRPERDLAENPLFSASFAFQNTPRTAVRLPGLDAEVLPSPPVAPKFPLALTATARADGGMGLELEFDRDRIAEPVARGILTSFHAALARAVADPEAPAAPVPAAAVDRRPGREGHECLHEPVARAAARHPDAVAVSCGGTQLSYGALDTRAERLAAVLRAHGAGPERLVALCLPTGPEWVVGALAILKSGAAYLPLDPGDPAERRASVAADAGATLIVSDTALPPLHRVDVTATLPDGAPEPTARAVLPGNLAYAVYTSGSTGGPKGVLVTHANVTGLLAACREALPALDAPRTWSATHSPAFDFSVWEVWGPLTAGGRLVLVPPDVARAPDELWDTLRDEQVEVLSQTPSAFHHLLPTAVRRAAQATALELVVLGGEACEPARLTPWWDALGDRRPAVVNMYGITENTIHVTVRRMTAADRSGSPVGRPLPGQRADLLDPHGRPVAPGGRGELFVGGVGLARGYLGRPGLTARSFLPDDTPGWPGARRYRSGDLARLLPDGGLDYAGRSDAQVKVRGYRVEPAETEAAALTHPAVRHCVVVPRGDGDRRHLAAYVVADTRACDGPGLRTHLAERLPRHLVPASVVFLKRIPLTRNGKLDVAALPDPAAHRAPARERPRTATERTLTRLLAALLKAPPETIGTHDNLFDLGGDSLTVTQFHSRVVEEFAVDLPVRRVYQALDIATLAVTVDDFRRRAERTAVLRALAAAEAMEPGGTAGESGGNPEESAATARGPAVAANEPGAAARESGAAPVEPAVAVQESAATKGEPGTAANELGAEAREPGTAAQEPGTDPRPPAATPQDPRTTPQEGQPCPRPE